LARICNEWNRSKKNTKKYFETYNQIRLNQNQNETEINNNRRVDGNHLFIPDKKLLIFMADQTDPNIKINLKNTILEFKPEYVFIQLRQG